MRNGRKKDEALRREEVIAGYRKLAFGAGNDALKLLFYEQTPPPEELASLDLFNVSDIKRPKGGGLEIKFFDRCEALLRLEAMDGDSGRRDLDGVKAFYEAIARSVKSED